MPAGNPNIPPGTGRRKGSKNKAPLAMASYVRDKTRDGEEIVQFFLDVFRGNAVSGRTPKLNDRKEAAEWLADRGFGRAPQRMEVDGGGTIAELLLRALGGRSDE